MYLARKLATFTALTGLGVALASGTAFAAGSGYGPTPPSNGAPGGFTAVTVSKTVPTSGGSVSATVPGGTLAITVPPGAFSTPTDVVVTSPNLASLNSALPSLGLGSFHALAGAGVDFLSSSGAPLTGTLPKPVKVKFSGSSLGAAGERAVELTGPTSATVVPSVLSPGSVTVSVSSDPNIAVLQPVSAPVTPVSSAVPGATSQHTGLPFRGEEYAAGLMALIGVAAMGAAAMRHRRASGAN